MGGAPLLWPPSFAVRSPRSEARHSCDLPRRGAHSYLLSGGGGVEGPFNMVREQFSEPRRHSRACLGANTLSLRGGGREGTVQHGPKSNPAGRGATHAATSARVRSFPACATSTTKSLPPCRCCGTRAGLRPRWHFTYVASSDAANPALGIRAGLRRGGISLMWPPPTRQTQPSAASRPIAHPPVQQSPQERAFIRGGISLMWPPPTRQTQLSA